MPICLILALSPELWLQGSLLRAESDFAAQKDAAVRLYQARKYFQAIEVLEAAMAKASTTERAEAEVLLARSHSALGVELFNAGENKKAEAAFTTSLGHAPDSYAQFGLGFLRFLRLDDEKSRGHLEEAAHLEPTYGPTQKLLALIEYRQGRSKEALTRVKEAVRLAPEDREARALQKRWELEAEWTGKFSERSAGRFLLRLDPDLPARRVEELVQMLERARGSLVEALALGDLPARPPGASRARPGVLAVTLMTTERFRRATGTVHWVGGLYDGQIKLPVSPERGDVAAEAELVAAVRHELVHAAIRDLGPECPNWLNEGLAQYFEVSAGGDSQRATTALRSARARRIPLLEIPARLWEVEDEALARLSYLEGLGFVEFLARRYRPFRLSLLLRALGEERSLQRALELTYGETLQELEKSWWRALDQEP